MLISIEGKCNPAMSRFKLCAAESNSLTYSESVSRGRTMASNVFVLSVCQSTSTKGCFDATP